MAALAEGGAQAPQAPPLNRPLQSSRNKASKIKKVCVSLFYADISKSEAISRWRPINKTLHYNFSATKIFF